jgi:hypothetical protein
MSRWRSLENPPEAGVAVLVTLVGDDGEPYVELAERRLSGYWFLAGEWGAIKECELWGWMPTPLPADMPVKLANQLSTDLSTPGPSRRPRNQGI